MLPRNTTRFTRWFLQLACCRGRAEEEWRVGGIDFNNYWLNREAPRAKHEGEMIPPRGKIDPRCSVDVADKVGMNGQWFSIMIWTTKTLTCHE